VFRGLLRRFEKVANTFHTGKDDIKRLGAFQQYKGEKVSQSLRGGGGGGQDWVGRQSTRDTHVLC
jgi:hypothetical protein